LTFPRGKAELLRAERESSEEAMRLAVADMTCSHCTAAVTAAVRGVDPEATVRTDIAAGTVEVETRVAPERLVAALEAAGYPARPA
jgi:copper chaperone